MKRKLHTLSLAGCTALKACPDETGHRQQASPSWSSDIHTHCRVCAAAGQFGEAMGVPVHILLKKPAIGLLHIC